jgi:hypothetical protein
LHREERDATTDARDENVMSSRDAGVHNRSPAYCARVSGDLATTLRAHGADDDAPPGCDTRNRPGGRTHVVEMGGRADDLLARDDDVCGECADGRVIPSSEEPKPSSVVRRS